MYQSAFFMICILLLCRSVQAQDCVVSDLFTRIPIRDVKVTVDSVFIGNTTWRGTCSLPALFRRASFEKKGYMRETLTQEEVRRDTIFLIPEAHQIEEVTIWGRRMINADSLRKGIPWKDRLHVAPHSPLEFDFAKMLDRRYRRDMKQLENMRNLFKKWDEQEKQRDPVLRAYEQTQAEMGQQKKELTTAK